MKQHTRKKKNLLAPMAAATITLVATTALAERVQWQLNEGGNGHEYEVVLTPEGVSWSDARAAAEAAGGHLATVSNMDELDFINSLDFAGTSKGWIGGYQDMNASDYSEPDGGWKWVTGEPWSFIGWWEGGPSSSPTRNYVQLAYTKCQDEIDVDNEGEWYVIEYGTPTATQWTIEDGGNGHWYAVLDTDYALQNWDVRRSEAEAMGGTLASITSSSENDFVHGLVQASLPGGSADAAVLLGGFTDTGSNDPTTGWQWVSGEPWSYHNFIVNNDTGLFLHAVMNWSGQWDDWSNEDPSRGYAVEWSADCNGDGIVDYGQILDGTYEDVNSNGVPDCCDNNIPCDGPFFTVDDDGPADFQTIQAAVNAAGSDATIVVYPGTYTSSNEQVVRMTGKNIHLRSVSGPESTIIDGQGSRRCIVIADGESSTIINGFTIINGHNGSSGGGLYSSYSGTLSLENMIFSNNHSGWEGGGLNIGQATSAMIDSCTFTGNTAFAGGGMAITSSNGSMVSNCQFEENSVVDDGAGLLAQQSSGLQIMQSTFTGNSAGDDGGALWLATCSEAIVKSCVVRDNMASSRAGGMHVQSQSSVTMLDCVVEGNRGHNGGGAFVDSASELTVQDCEFNLNQGDGGAIQMQGGTASIINSLFKGNTAFDAGAIYCWNAVLEVFNCEFIQNAADDDGGAMLLGGGTSATIGETRFCENTAPNGTHVYGDFTDAGDNTFQDNCNCPEDVDDDGVVNVNDVLIIIAEYGTSNPLGDVNSDGAVNVNDLLQVLSQFGLNCG